MKAVIRKLDGRCAHLFPDEAVVTLTADKLESPILAFGVSTATHEIVTVPEPPSKPYGAYRWVSGAWVVADQGKVDAALDAIKAGLRDKVNTLRDQKLLEDFTFGGVVYQADERSQERLDRARASALAAIIGGAQQGDYRWHGENVDFFWIAKDNSQTVMDAQTTLAFGNAMVAREGMLIAAGSAIKAAIDAAADHAAVTAIDITTGWPV